MAEPDTIERMQLCRTLESSGQEVVGEAADGAAVVTLARQRHPDLVIMALESREAIAAVRILRTERVAPVLWLAACADSDWIGPAVDAGVMACLIRPCADEVLSVQSAVAVTRWRELQRLERALAKMRERLRTRGLVERAKHALMQAHPGLTEDQAYVCMRTVSMQSRTALHEVARRILLAYEAPPTRRRAT